MQMQYHFLITAIFYDAYLLIISDLYILMQIMLVAEYAHC